MLGHGVTRSALAFEAEGSGAVPDALTKLCGRCLQVKNLTAFNRNKKKKDGFHAYCRDCMKQYLQEHYSRNKEYYANKRKHNVIALRKLIYKQLQETPCSMCGEQDIRTLEFHHVDPKQKVGNVCKLALWGSKNKVLNEIKKCVVLCANCHRKVTYRDTRRSRHA